VVILFALWPQSSKGEKYYLTTNNCTGEAFGELFLAMTDNLSSKCFAPTNNCTGEAFGELFLAMTDNLSSKCFAPTNN
jgi:3-hydroxy acid dehydrogenase / malonic semialdehyde reductase